MFPGKYECCVCKCVFLQEPLYSIGEDRKFIGKTVAAESCPNCGSLYVRWLNYRKNSAE